MQQDWLTTMVREFSAGQTSPTAMEFMTATPQEQIAALQQNSAAILSLFKAANPSGENFPFIATMAALTPGSSITPGQYFAWLRYHPMCVSYNAENLIVAINAYLIAKDASAHMKFKSVLSEQSGHSSLRQSSTKYENYKETNANKLSNAAAYRQIMTIDLGVNMDFDAVLDCTDVLTPEQIAAFFKRRLAEFNGVAIDYNYFLAEVVYKIRSYVNLKDLDYLNVKVIIPHIQEVMFSTTETHADSSGDISIVFALAAEYFQRLHLRNKFEPKHKEIVQNMLNYYLTQAASFDYLLEGWPTTFYALNFTLTPVEQEMLLDLTYSVLDPRFTSSLDEGACRILFMYEKPEDLVQCPKYKISPTPDAQIRSKVQNIAAIAQSIYTGLPINNDIPCATNMNFLPAYSNKVRKPSILFARGDKALAHNSAYIYVLASIFVFLALGLAYKLTQAPKPAFVFKPPRRRGLRYFGG